MGLLLGLLPVQKFLLTHHQYKQFYQGVAKCGHRKFSFSFLIQISEHFHIYSRLHWANHPDLDIITWIHMMPILAIGDDIRSGTKANACHGQMQAAWEPRWLQHKKVFKWMMATPLLSWITQKLDGFRPKTSWIGSGLGCSDFYVVYDTNTLFLTSCSSLPITMISLWNSLSPPDVKTVKQRENIRIYTVLWL